MRSAWMVLLLLATGLSGCTEDGIIQGIQDFVSGGKSLSGTCGHVYDDGLDRQIILDVVFTNGLDAMVDVDDIKVDATYFGPKGETDSSAKPYVRDRSVDGKGCIGFLLKDEGQYMFWGIAPWADREDCFVSGRLAGNYNGQPIVEGTLLVDTAFGGSSGNPCRTPTEGSA